MKSVTIVSQRGVSDIVSQKQKWRALTAKKSHQRRCSAHLDHILAIITDKLEKRVLLVVLDANIVKAPFGGQLCQKKKNFK